MAGTGNHPDWVPVEPFPTGTWAQTFLFEGENSQRLRIQYFKRQTDGALIARAWFGPGTQGPPGHAHGGSMASLLDEVMGGCAWMHGHPVVAVRLVTEFRNRLPLGTEVIAEGLILRREGRKIFTRGAIRDAASNLLYAEGEAIFVILTDAQLKEMHMRRIGNDAEGTDS